MSGDYRIGYFSQIDVCAASFPVEADSEEKTDDS